MHEPLISRIARANVKGCKTCWRAGLVAAVIYSYNPLIALLCAACVLCAIFKPILLIYGAFSTMHYRLDMAEVGSSNLPGPTIISMTCTTSQNPVVKLL